RFHCRSLLRVKKCSNFNLLILWLFIIWLICAMFHWFVLYNNNSWITRVTMKENNKTAFVTFSTKYLKTTVSPTYSEFVSVVKEAGFLISHEWYAKENGRT